MELAGSAVGALPEGGGAMAHALLGASLCLGDVEWEALQTAREAVCGMRGWREALEAAASAVAAGASASSASFSASSYLASPQLSAGDVAAALTAAGRGGSSGRWGTKAGLEAVFASIATQLRLTGSKGRGTASASEPAPVLPLGLTACLLTPLSQPALHAALSLRRVLSGGVGLVDAFLPILEDCALQASSSLLGGVGGAPRGMPPSAFLTAVQLLGVRVEVEAGEEGSSSRLLAAAAAAEAAAARELTAAEAAAAPVPAADADTSGASELSGDVVVEGGGAVITPLVVTAQAAAAEAQVSAAAAAAPAPAAAEAVQPAPAPTFASHAGQPKGLSDTVTSLVLSVRGGHCSHTPSPLHNAYFCAPTNPLFFSLPLALRYLFILSPPLGIFFFVLDILVSPLLPRAHFSPTGCSASAVLYLPCQWNQQSRGRRAALQPALLWLCLHTGPVAQSPWRREDLFSNHKCVSLWRAPLSRAHTPQRAK